MSVILKPDADEILHHITRLQAKSWLGPAQARWPELLFRFDDVEAAATILNTGMLLSREAALNAELVKFDSASPEIIAKTADRWKKYVRLYFRPRSPTQYANEGFRSASKIRYDAHCPVPVVFVFDAASILTRSDSLFSDGNLGAGARTGNSARFLSRVPFDKVYHDKYLEPSEKRSIIYHRNAEVIVPNQLNLKSLRFVGCRTTAEYETLLNLLSVGALDKWQRMIGLGTKANLHFRRWLFVERVTLGMDSIVFRFNPSTEDPGPFKARVEIAVPATGKTHVWEKSVSPVPVLSFNLKNLNYPIEYHIRLTLDGRLAYSNRFEQYDVPF